MYTEEQWDSSYRPLFIKAFFAEPDDSGTLLLILAITIPIITIILFILASILIYRQCHPRLVS
jgi:hypothetical protein